MPKTRFTADLEPELYTWLEEYCKEKGISRNEALKQAVELMREEEDRKMKFTNLQDLTKQESGIILYGKQGILCNWSGYDGLPRMFAAGLVAMGEEIPDIPGEHYSDLSDLLDGVDITAYADDAEIPTSGTVYRLDDDVIVIAPDEWN